MSCQQVPTTPAFNPYPRSVQVGEFEVAIGGGIWVAIRGGVSDSPEYISYRRRGAKGSLSSSEKSFREIHWKGPT